MLPRGHTFTIPLCLQFNYIGLHIKDNLKRFLLTTCMLGNGDYKDNSGGNNNVCYMLFAWTLYLCNVNSSCVISGL